MSSCAHFQISFSDSFITAYTTIVPVLGFFAVVINALSILSIAQQTRVLPIEYTKCLVILKIIVFVYDFHLCFFFVAFPLFPCQGLFMQGLGAYIGMKTHATLVLNLTILSTMCVWYTCCLFQRYQSMLPAYHSYKLRRSEMYLGYFVLNLMMIVNPLLLAVTIKSDEILQRIQLRQTPMSWLLSTLSFKIYNDENSPLLAPFHLPLTIITFVLNTATTIFFANHTDRLMKARRDHVSPATVTMNTELVKNVQFESNVSTVGMVTPFVFWTVSMFFQFDASEVSTLLLLLLPLGSIVNSCHSIATNKSSSIKEMFGWKPRRRRRKMKSSTVTIHVSVPSDKF